MTKVSPHPPLSPWGEGWVRGWFEYWVVGIYLGFDYWDLTYGVAINLTFYK